MTLNGYSGKSVRWSTIPTGQKSSAGEEVVVRDEGLITNKDYIQGLQLENLEYRRQVRNLASDFGLEARQLDLKV